VFFHCNSQTIPVLKKNPSNPNSLHRVLQLVGLLKVRRYHPLAQQINVENHPLSAACGYLLNIFLAISIYGAGPLYPQPEDAPCRGDKEITLHCKPTLCNEKKSNCTDLPKENGEIVTHHH
jgi:hypothetical protein